MRSRDSSIFLTSIILSVCFLTIIASAENQSLLQQNCPIRSIPQKFAILTTTYIRSKSTQMINGYLEKYAESDCDIYENIYIVWNNQETPQEMGVLQNSHKWKKNVYFMQTVENSLDFKYIVPVWAKQKVFFGMDDDFDISCQTFKLAFRSWKNLSYGEVGPLASFYARSFVFEPQTQSFSYIDQVKLNPDWKYFHFALTGIAFIPRHFLEMYYSDIFQLKEMRKMVVEKNNCEDLLLNFMVEYLYPQLVPEYLNVPFKSLGKRGVSTTKTHKQYRAECISRFTQILGFNPIRYISSNKNKTLMQKKTPINEKCLINLKQEHFQKNFINNRAYFMYIKRITGVNNDFIKSQNDKLIEAKKDIQEFMKKRKQEIQLQTKDKKPQIKIEGGISENDKKILQQVQMGIHFGSEQQIQSYMNKIQPQKTKEQTKKADHLQKDNKFKEQFSQIQESSTQIQHIIYIIIFSLIVLCLMCIKKIIDSKISKYHTVPQTFSSEI